MAAPTAPASADNLSNGELHAKRNKRRRLLAAGGVGGWFLVTIVIGKVVFPHVWGTLATPSGVYLEAVINGLLSSLVAVGLVLMVVIGGMGSPMGAVLGALFVRGIAFFLPYQLQILTTGFGILLVLALFPGGLGQVAFGTRDRLLRMVARRRNVVSPSLDADRFVQPDSVVSASANLVATSTYSETMSSTT